MAKRVSALCKIKKARLGGPRYKQNYNQLLFKCTGNAGYHPTVGV
jgi:hypothetical protein